mgnify:CR=1 FL=1
MNRFLTLQRAAHASPVAIAALVIANAVPLVGVLVLAFVVARSRPKTRWPALPWVAAGIMLAFVVLGGFSIGPFLIPAFLAFLVTGVLVDVQTGAALARHIGLLIVAAVIQGALMALAILIT